MTENKKYTYFSHRECNFFPCHPDAEPENFNCLFCYCPLYPLGAGCGGRFAVLPDGRKDCSGCLYPHLRESYEEIVRRCGENSHTSLPSGRQQPAPRGQQVGVERQGQDRRPHLHGGEGNGSCDGPGHQSRQIDD